MILRIVFVYIIYLVVVGALFWLRPSMMFDRDGNIKSVGFIDEDGSLLSLYIVLPIVAIFLYIVFLAWTK